jgi:MFS superfamily sulfate permease-like transporter
MLKKDNLKLGIVLGILAPVLGMLIYYLIAFLPRHVPFSEYLGYLKQYKSLLTAVSSISLVANAVLFTVYINGRRDRTARGIFIATLLYGISVLLLKLF